LLAAWLVETGSWQGLRFSIFNFQFLTWKLTIENGAAWQAGQLAGMMPGTVASCLAAGGRGAGYWLGIQFSIFNL